MGDSTIQSDIAMTRDEARNFMRAIDGALKSNTAYIQAVQRKRSWTPAERAMAIAEREQRAESLRLLAQRIGEAFALGGY